MITIREMAEERIGAAGDLGFRLSWATIRQDVVFGEATLTLTWIVLDPFAGPSARADTGVTLSGGETSYNEEIDLGEREPPELERDVLESAWILAAPDVARTEDGTEVRWGFHAGGKERRESKTIEPYALKGAGSRMEVSL